MATPKKALIVFNRLHYLILHRMHLVERLIAEGVALEVLGGGTVDEIQQLREAGAVVHPIEMDSFKIRPLQDFKNFRKLRSVIANGNFDVVNVHSIKMMFLTQTAIRTLLSNSRPTGLVLSFAGLGRMFFDDVSMLVKLWRRIFLTSLANPTLEDRERIIVETQADKVDLVSMGKLDPQRFTISFGAGIDTEKFSPDAQNIKRDPKAPLSFLFAGRLLRSKGVLEYLAAAKLLLSNGENARFQIAGRIENDDPDGIQLEEIRTFEKLEGFEYLGAIPADQMPALLSKTDIVCLASSYREGIPRILLESAACECTFVATRIPGWTEIVGRGNELGWYIEAPTSGALVEAFKQVLSDPKNCRIKAKNMRKKMLEAGVSEREVQDRVLSAYSKAMEQS